MYEEDKRKKRTEVINEHNNYIYIYILTIMILFLKREKKIHDIENNYYKNFRMNIYCIQKNKFDFIII